jgi:hypothetical protein
VLRVCPGRRKGWGPRPGILPESLPLVLLSCLSVLEKPGPKHMESRELAGGEGLKGGKKSRFLISGLEGWAGLRVRVAAQAGS